MDLVRMRSRLVGRVASVVALGMATLAVVAPAGWPVLARDGGAGLGAEILITPSFRIVVERHCPEGTVICDRVSYWGRDRRTGSSLRLMGSTDYHICPDGVTPCRFLGYLFRNGDYSYFVGEEGDLVVRQSGRVLLREQGEWQR